MVDFELVLEHFIGELDFSDALHVAPIPAIFVLISVIARDETTAEVLEDCDQQVFAVGVVEIDM